MPVPLKTDPSGFENPHSLGNKIARVLWAVVRTLLFRPTPARLCVGWRNWLLRRFGARIGRSWVHPSVRIWAPWRLEIGDDVAVDEHVFLYNPFGIRIEDRVVISLRSFLCTASHDHTDPTYPLVGGAIVVGRDSWIAGEAFVGPGITLGVGTVVAARSVVVKDTEPWTVVAGNPARSVGRRELRGAPA